MEYYTGTIKEKETITGTITEAAIIKYDTMDITIITGIELTDGATTRVNHGLNTEYATFELRNSDNNIATYSTNYLKAVDNNNVDINSNITGTYKLIIIYKK